MGVLKSSCKDQKKYSIKLLFLLYQLHVPLPQTGLYFVQNWRYILQWQFNRKLLGAFPTQNIFFVLWQHSSVQSMVYDGIKSFHIFLEKRDLLRFFSSWSLHRLQKVLFTRRFAQEVYQNCKYLGCTFLGNGAYSFNQVFKKLGLK